MKKALRRIAVVPARGGSKRVPLKNIADLLGKPAITYVLDVVRDSGLFSEIHVSTDSPLIRSIVEGAGYPVTFDRPSEFSADTTPILDVTRWVVGEYARRGLRFDVVATIMPTAVLLEATQLLAAIRLFEREASKQPIVAVVEATSPLEKAMTMDATGALRPLHVAGFSRRTQEGHPIYFDAGSFFVATPDQIERPGPTLEHLKGFRLPAYAAVDVDDSEDLELARRLLAGRLYLSRKSDLS